MKYLFGAAQADVLPRLAAARVLVALDFDGTLAPIVADRDTAAMRLETSALLTAVAARYPCAVVSGRSRRDVAARVAVTRIRALVGNHGLEPGPRARLAAFAVASRRARLLLESALAGVPGVDIEDKRYSLAIHHRAAPRRADARRAIVAAIEALPVAMRVVLGDQVVNAVPAGAPHKGDAVRDLRQQLRCEVVLYVGDDVTDEDVFATGGPALVGVRVGASTTSAAAYYVRDQREIDRLLRELVALRAGSAGAGLRAAAR